MVDAVFNWNVWHFLIGRFDKNLLRGNVGFGGIIGQVKNIHLCAFVGIQVIHARMVPPPEQDSTATIKGKTICQKDKELPREGSQIVKKAW